MHRYMLCVSCFAAVNANFENKVVYAQKHMPERRRNTGWKDCVFRQPKKHMAYRKKYKAHIFLSSTYKCNFLGADNKQ